MREEYDLLNMLSDLLHGLYMSSFTWIWSRGAFCVVLCWQCHTLHHVCRVDYKL